MKSKRQEEILALIQEQNIETQNQLIEALRKRGVKAHRRRSRAISASFVW